MVNACIAHQVTIVPPAETRNNSDITGVVLYEPRSRRYQSQNHQLMNGPFVREEHKQMQM